MIQQFIIAVKPLSTGHPWSQKHRSLFGGVSCSEGSFFGKYVVCSIKNIRYLEVSAVWRYLLKDVSLYNIWTDQISSQMYHFIDI